MPRTKSSSSSPPASERLLQIPLDRLHPHPLNANLMADERLAKLAENIAREGRYPPLIVRPHPEITGGYQLLDGHQRTEALRRLGHLDALCFLWPCDDATALVLLATLNRLEGEDVPSKRADLLRELSSLLPPEELALLLPEDASAIADTLALFDLDSERLLAELTAAAARGEASAPRLISFVVLREDEAVIEEAVAQASLGLSGNNKRGRALATLACGYLEHRHG